MSTLSLWMIANISWFAWKFRLIKIKIQNIQACWSVKYGKQDERGPMPGLRYSAFNSKSHLHVVIQTVSPSPSIGLYYPQRSRRRPVTDESKGCAENQHTKRLKRSEGPRNKWIDNLNADLKT